MDTGNLTGSQKQAGSWRGLAHAGPAPCHEQTPLGRAHPGLTPSRECSTHMGSKLVLLRGRAGNHVHLPSCPPASGLRAGWGGWSLPCLFPGTMGSLSSGSRQSAEVLVMGCGLTLRGATGSAQAQGGSSRCHQAGAHPPGIRAHLGLVLLPGRLGGPLGKVGGWALVSGLV